MMYCDIEMFLPAAEAFNDIDEDTAHTEPSITKKATSTTKPTISQIEITTKSSTAHKIGMTTEEPTPIEVVVTTYASTTNMTDSAKTFFDLKTILIMAAIVSLSLFCVAVVYFHIKRSRVRQRFVYNIQYYPL